MAIGVEQHSVFSPICPTVYQTHDVVVVPPRQFGDLLVADRAKTMLFSPKRAKLPFPFQVVYHLHAQAFLEVPFPFWVIRVCISFDFRVPLYRDCVGVEELNLSGGSVLFLYFSAKHPISLPNGMKVFLFYPSSWLFWMPPFGPLP